MRSPLLALFAALTALSAPGCSLEDECISVSGSYGGFCDGDGYIYCFWDRLQGRNRHECLQHSPGQRGV